MSIAVYPGSFDPITTGHMDVVERASKLFDKVTILIMQNVEKNGMFTYHERMLLCEEAVKGMDNVEVDVSRGLVADYCRNNDIHYIVKGLRSTTDFEYELNMERFNSLLNSELETCFLAARPDQTWVSSSAVRELISYDADISLYVPKAILPLMAEFRSNIQL